MNLIIHHNGLGIFYDSKACFFSQNEHTSVNVYEDAGHS